ncbi:MAG: WecB/TagA/CpsF family glycosyltransferase [Leptolinea sp.]|jgi:UDP-N-acetyl-D-mannosaminouronate:lipid I N-acetyl-D-mannosaminouronosyltransferase|nr:WecB/TagA/CpsF family glycosyltransferase [Leptolinea sp.]
MVEAYLNGKRTYAVQSKEDLLAFIKNKKAILIAMNTEKILREDIRLREIINSNIGYPDGVGAVLAMRRKGIPARKIPGAVFWLEIVKAFHLGKTFYLLGSKSDIINMTVIKLKKEYPGIKILGYRDGYFTDAEYVEIKQDIQQRKPDVIFVALGSPRQEYVMADLIAVHPALYMGLGGSLDLFCGKVKAVPDWWCRYFIWEGLYRALSDMGNIQRWKRQLPAMRIIYKILLGRL